MKVLVAFFLVQLLMVSTVLANSGHRLGGDIYKPENTLHSFKLALKNLQKNSDFRYAELDIQESKDKRPIVFHDTKSISRVVPKSRSNLLTLNRILRSKRFENIKISDLYEKEIKKLVLANNARIPTLKSVLDAAVKWNLRKPLLIEVKLIRSDKCRMDTINLVSKYRGALNVNFIASESNYKKSFPDPLRWSHTLKKNSLNVYAVGKPKNFSNDLSGGFNQNANTWRFSTILERSLYFKNDKTRVIKIPFKFKKEKGAKYGIRVGINNGYDESGDKGLFFKLHSKKSGALYLSGFSREKGWEWYQTIGVDSSEMTITLEDLDTKFVGKYPGNGARVKINLIKL